MSVTPRMAVRAWLTLRSWIALASYDAVHSRDFRRTYERLRRCQPRRADSVASIDDVVWAVDEACVWYFKRVACLQRSIVAARLLRRCGIPAELVIGYRPVPFESHAWVEVAGAVVNDLPQYQSKFTVLDRL